MAERPHRAPGEFLSVRGVLDHHRHRLYPDQHRRHDDAFSRVSARLLCVWDFFRNGAFPDRAVPYPRARVGPGLCLQFRTRHRGDQPILRRPAERLPAAWPLDWRIRNPRLWHSDLRGIAATRNARASADGRRALTLAARAAPDAKRAEERKAVADAQKVVAIWNARQAEGRELWFYPTIG